MMPLMPGFAGNLEDSGSALQAVMHWTFQSICDVSSSIYDLDKYVMFGSLRTFGRMPKKQTQIVTELVYIHSKLIIVDDRQVLIGSANINDRSQLGNRDSEVAIFVEDTETYPSIMNGHPYDSGKFAGSLRRHLFKEHLGLLPAQVAHRQDVLQDFEWHGGPLADPLTTSKLNDCVSDAFWNEVWWKTARENTRLFEMVFNCYPTDKVERIEDLSDYERQKPLLQLDPKSALKHLTMVQGQLVVFPLKFLRKSNLLPSMMTKEGWAPTELFT